MRSVKRTPHIFLLFCLLSTILFSEAQAQPTIYIVRHAEKLANWPGGETSAFQPLSAEGLARAEELVGRFEGIHLKAIYSSLTTRTLHTAFPLSQKLSLPITVAKACQDTSAISAFLSELNEAYEQEDAVLLISHSNIIPYMLMKAGLPKGCHDEMGFTTSTSHSWIVIQGYDNIWKLDSRRDKALECGGIRKLKF
ncbi:MAG: phosphoglycerate mutase family protein [bacterium]